MAKKRSWDVTTLDQLDHAAADIAQLLSPGQIVLLDGEMGAGKTTFVRALASHLNTVDHVSSPTFSLIQRYQADIPLVHMDLYRLETPNDILNLDLDRYLDDSESIKLIEWPSRLGDIALESPVFLDWEINDQDGDVERCLSWSA